MNRKERLLKKHYYQFIRKIGIRPKNAPYKSYFYEKENSVMRGYIPYSVVVTSGVPVSYVLEVVVAGPRKQNSGLYTYSTLAHMMGDDLDYTTKKEFSIKCSARGKSRKAYSLAPYLPQIYKDLDGVNPFIMEYIGIYSMIKGSLLRAGIEAYAMVSKDKNLLSKIFDLKRAEKAAETKTDNV